MVNMRAQSFLRSLSSKLSMGRRSTSPTVVPLFEQSQFSHLVADELSTLQCSDHEFGCSSWLVDVLNATIATQKLAHESLAQGNYSNIASNADKELIDSYLEEDNVELLDACNALVEKIDIIQNYVASLKTTARLLDSYGSTSQRAREMLNECCRLERVCVAMDKSGPKLCRLMGRKSNQSAINNAWEREQDVELNEVVSMSKEVALVTCHRLQRALSFKSKPMFMRMKSNVSSNWSNSLKFTPNNSMMKELEEVVKASRMLQDQVKSSHNKVINVDLDLVRRRCEALEEGMKPLEEKVRALYRYLISIRIILLGILSQ